MIRVEIVDKEFDQVLRQVMAQTNKTAAQVCNEKAVKVASYAIQMTPQSNIDKIRSELGQAGTALTLSKRNTLRKKAGKYYARRGREQILFAGETIADNGQIIGAGLQVEKRKVAKVAKIYKRSTRIKLKLVEERSLKRVGKAGPITLAHRIVLRDLWNEHPTGLEFRYFVRDRSALDELAKRLIARRVASVGYLKAGWQAALDDLWFQVKTYDPSIRIRHPDGARKKPIFGRGERKILGRARAAVPGNNPFALIISQATGQKNKVRIPEEGKMVRLERALRNAFRIATTDMKRYMEEKLQKAYNKITGGRR